LLDVVDQEVGINLQDEPLRMKRFNELRRQKDIASKRAKLKKELENELDSQDDIWKSGKIVKYITFIVGLAFVGLSLFIIKDLGTLKPSKNSKKVK
jgi:hypothetical protein